MKNWKKILSLGLILVLVISLSACSGSSDSGSDADETTDDASADGASESTTERVSSGETVNVAALINTDGLAVWYADKMGYFDELGVDANITYFTNGTLENEALAASEADVGFNGFAGIYSLATGDYTMVADCNDGKGLAIYVNPDCALLDVEGAYPIEDEVVYGDADSAAGLSFAATLGTIQQIMVDAYYANLEQTDYEIVGMDVASCYNALISGEVDGAALTMNYCAAAEEAGMVCLGTYEGITGVNQGATVIVPNDYLETNEDDVVLVLEAVFKALDEIQNDEDLEYEQGMEFFAEQGTEYSESEMWTEIETRDLYSYEKLAEIEYGSWVVFSAEWLVTLGLLEEDTLDTVSDSITKDLLEEATGVEITLGI